mmetsp:Transcript_21845/g.28252  ORF Transcript_21845/g.28252 Transcript_21845/m.28252 type:complete len:455 (-) Transcript_21845:38-1402(-)
MKETMAQLGPKPNVYLTNGDKSYLRNGDRSYLRNGDNKRGNATTAKRNNNKCMGLMVGILVTMSCTVILKNQLLENLEFTRKNAAQQHEHSTQGEANIRLLTAIDDDHSNAKKKKKVKVFFLAGQSNMLGQGELAPFVTMMNMSCHKEFRETLWDEDTQDFKIHDRVYIKFRDNQGQLTLGHNTRYADRDKFGPEVMFGWTLGDAFGNKNNETGDDDVVYLIKVAYGGRDLAIDFRPPSARIRIGGNDIKQQFDGFTNEETEENISVKQQLIQDQQQQQIMHGYRFRTMIQEFHEGLDALPDVIPGATEYEIAGFVWFQGETDLSSEEKSKEYATNLKHLIRDVRREFGVSMPCVIGEVGYHGLHPNGDDRRRRVLEFRAEVKGVTHLKEFQNNTLYVPTAQYALLDRNVERYNKGFHYYGRPDTYYYIGKALGEGMVQLLTVGLEKGRMNSTA